MKTLSKSEGKRFHKLIDPLLIFVYQKAPEDLYKNKKEAFIIPDSNVPTAKYLWEHTELIDAYLNDEKTKVSARDRELMLSWKNRISGTFALTAFTLNGGILVELDSHKVYLVKGIISSWEEMAGNRPLPIIFEGTILPYGHSIVTDGILRNYNMVIGPNMAKQFTDIWKEAEKKDEVIRSI